MHRIFSCFGCVAAEQSSAPGLATDESSPLPSTTENKRKVSEAKGQSCGVLCQILGTGQLGYHVYRPGSHSSEPLFIVNPSYSSPDQQIGRGQLGNAAEIRPETPTNRPAVDVSPNPTTTDNFLQGSSSPPWPPFKPAVGRNDATTRSEHARTRSLQLPERLLRVDRNGLGSEGRVCSAQIVYSADGPERKGSSQWNSFSSKRGSKSVNFDPKLKQYSVDEAGSSSVSILELPAATASDSWKACYRGRARKAMRPGDRPRGSAERHRHPLYIRSASTTQLPDREDYDEDGGRGLESDSLHVLIASSAIIIGDPDSPPSPRGSMQEGPTFPEPQSLVNMPAGPELARGGGSVSQVTALAGATPPACPSPRASSSSSASKPRTVTSMQSRVVSELAGALGVLQSTCGLDPAALGIRVEGCEGGAAGSATAMLTLNPRDSPTAGHDDGDVTAGPAAEPGFMLDTHMS